MISRRGMLSGLLGTAAAGPAVAGSLAKSLAGMTATQATLRQGLGNSVGTNYASTMIGGAEHLTGIRQRLTDHRSGKAERKAEQAMRLRGVVDEAEVNALRSVSMRHRTHMLVERQVERQHREEEHWILRELRMAEEGAR